MLSPSQDISFDPPFVSTQPFGALAKGSQTQLPSFGGGASMDFDIPGFRSQLDVEKDVRALDEFLGDDVDATHFQEGWGSP